MSWVQHTVRSHHYRSKTLALLLHWDYFSVAKCTSHEDKKTWVTWRVSLLILIISQNCILEFLALRFYLFLDSGIIRGHLDEWKFIKIKTLLPHLSNHIDQSRSLSQYLVIYSILLLSCILQILATYNRNSSFYFTALAHLHQHPQIVENMSHRLRTHIFDECGEFLLRERITREIEP